MLAGTAALSKFRQQPQPEWNERALAAFQRALALSAARTEPLAWADAAISAAQILHDLARHAEAEALLREALKVQEAKLGLHDPRVVIVVNNLASLLLATNRLAEAEPLIRRGVAIFDQFGRKTGHLHPNTPTAFGNYRDILQAMKLPGDEIAKRIKDATAKVGSLKPIAPKSSGFSVQPSR